MKEMKQQFAIVLIIVDRFSFYWFRKKHIMVRFKFSPLSPQNNQRASLTMMPENLSFAMKVLIWRNLEVTTPILKEVRMILKNETNQ